MAAKNQPSTVCQCSVEQLLYLLEIVRRKRLSVRATEWAYRLAFFLFLLPLIVLIFYVDMDRLGWFDPIKRLFGP